MASLPQADGPVPAALIFLKHPEEESLLFIHRKKQPYLGLWGLPGGRIHTGEHPLEAAEREIHEETSVRAVDLKVTSVVSEVFHLDGKKPFHTILFLVEALAQSDEIKCSLEGELDWFPVPLEESTRDKIIPTDKVFISRLYQKEKGIFRADMFVSEKGYSLERFQCLSGL